MSNHLPSGRSSGRTPRAELRGALGDCIASACSGARREGDHVGDSAPAARVVVAWRLLAARSFHCAWLFVSSGKVKLSTVADDASRQAWHPSSTVATTNEIIA